MTAILSPMDVLRARLLAAMGLSSLAGCPPAKEPAPTSVTADAAVATTAATPAPTAIPEPVDAAVEAEVADVAPETADVATVAVADAGIKKKPPAPKLPPLPSTAWYVSYPLAKPTADYCKNGSAVCVSLEWATKHYGKPGQPTCPAEIVEECRCPGGMSCKEDPLFGPSPCPDTFHTVITANQRAAGKKDACCYAQPVMCTPPWVGRALRDDRDVVLRASSQRRTDWLADDLPASTLGEPERAAIAAHYADVAAGEHASVASFAHTSLELMAHGAPAELLVDTHRAALDEIEHARIGYALASEYGGAPIGPSPLVSTRALAPTLTELALSTLRDAVVPEAIGAVLAAEVARTATVPSVRVAMARIAEDEARHAELAFRTLAWAVRAGGREVLEAVRAAPIEPPMAVASLTLPAHGLLGTETERALIAHAMANVVEPCLAALIA